MTPGDDQETSRSRQRGLRQMLIGVAIFVPGLLLFLFARDWLLSTSGAPVNGEVRARIPRLVAIIIGGPMALGYVLGMTGFYKAVFGARGRTMTAGWSVFRILFGLVATFSAIIALVAVLAVIRRS